MAGDDVQGAAARGLSRRQMIKASAAAGAAAWTAPVIIDSLSSPAAALSCVPYFAKIAVRGASPFNCPGSGSGVVPTQANGTPSEVSGVSFPVSGDKWGSTGSGAPSGCGLASGANKISSVTIDGTYRKVTLVAGCYFTSATAWQIGGRYGTSDPGDRYIKVTGRTTASGDGYFTDGGTTGWTQDLYPPDTSRKCEYVYVQFCCSS